MFRARSLVAILNRFQPSAEAVMLVSAIAVGLISGTGVMLFRKLIILSQQFYWHDLSLRLNNWHPWTVVLVPILGALVVSGLRLKLDQLQAGRPENKNSQAVAKEVGQLPYAQVPLKTAAAALSLGAGASLGPEGPSVELGSNVGALLGQLLQFSSERNRLLIAAGGAAGLSAGFNAPIAGVFFALEVLLRNAYRTGESAPNSDISVVVIAAVVSALVAQLGLGEQPAFSLPVYEVRSYWELPLYMLLGGLASVVAVTFSRSLKFAQQLFAGEIRQVRWLGLANLGWWAVPLKLIIGGFCVGLAALTFPEVISIGYETVESLLQDSPFRLSLLATLLILKVCLTSISVASGFFGGIFAPSIFLGAVLGSLYGQSMGILLPTIPIAAPPAYALVGMAAVLAGIVRAPLTSVLLLFEMTRDYRIVLPLMAAVGLCVWLMDQIMATKPFRPSMQWSEPPENIAVLATIKIAEVMSLNPPSVRSTMPLLQAAQFITSGYYHSAIVLDEANHLQGILTTQDIKRILTQPQTDPDTLTVGKVCTPDVLYTFADESLAEALKRMATRDLRQLPVVDRHLPKRVIGLIDRQVITTAYNTALTRQAITDRMAAQKLVVVLPAAPVTPAPINAVESETNLNSPNLTNNIAPNNTAPNNLNMTQINNISGTNSANISANPSPSNNVVSSTSSPNPASVSSSPIPIATMVTSSEEPEIIRN
jgi:H+/Cl- antiporter ClcA/predicted transcriptional regulator